MAIRKISILQSDGTWATALPIGTDSDNVVLTSTISDAALSAGASIGAAKVVSGDTGTGAWNKHNQLCDHVVTLDSHFTNAKTEMSQAFNEAVSSIHSEWSAYQSSMTSSWNTVQGNWTAFSAALSSSWSAFENSINSQWSTFRDTTIPLSFNTYKTDTTSSINSFMTSLASDVRSIASSALPMAKVVSIASDAWNSSTKTYTLSQDSYFQSAGYVYWISPVGFNYEGVFAHAIDTDDQITFECMALPSSSVQVNIARMVEGTTS